jgi:hypothetical protein
VNLRLALLRRLELDDIEPGTLTAHMNDLESTVALAELD